MTPLAWASKLGHTRVGTAMLLVMEMMDMLPTALDVQDQVGCLGLGRAVRGTRQYG